MKEEMKESIYSVLKLIDFLETVDFLTVDYDKVKQLREVLLTNMREEPAVSEAQGNDARKEEVKKSIYSVLNLIDFLGNVDFLTVDYGKINQLREILFDSIKEKKVRSAIEEAQEDFKEPTTEKAKPSNFMNMWFNYFENYGKEKRADNTPYLTEEEDEDEPCL